MMCNNWRSAKKGYVRNKISDYEIDELNKLDFDWAKDKKDITTPPEKKIEVIKAFLEHTEKEEGKVRFPMIQETFKYEDKEYNVGKMCAIWRSSKKGLNHYKISDYEINELNNLGFNWTPRSTGPSAQKIFITGDH